MTGVRTAAAFGSPGAYCEDGNSGCEWEAIAPAGDPNPGGHCHRAAQQHTRDTGHQTVVVVEHMTMYTPEGATHA